MDGWELYRVKMEVLRNRLQDKMQRWVENPTPPEDARVAEFVHLFNVAVALRSFMYHGRVVEQPNFNNIVTLRDCWLKRNRDMQMLIDSLMHADADLRALLPPVAMARPSPMPQPQSLAQPRRRKKAQRPEPADEEGVAFDV